MASFQDALANAGSNCRQTNGETRSDRGQRRDPDRALIGKCRLWGSQRNSAQSCSGTGVRRSGHMGTLRSWHECGEERTARQQHGTSQHVRAGHCFGSIQKPPASDPQQLLRWQSKLIRTNALALTLFPCTQLRCAFSHLPVTFPSSYPRATPHKAAVDMSKVGGICLQEWGDQSTNQRRIHLSAVFLLPYPAHFCLRFLPFGLHTSRPCTVALVP